MSDTESPGAVLLRELEARRDMTPLEAMEEAIVGRRLSPEELEAGERRLLLLDLRLAHEALRLWMVDPEDALA